MDARRCIAKCNRAVCKALRRLVEAAQALELEPRLAELAVGIFGPAIAEALAGRLEHWLDTPDAALAYLLLLDQFTRNAFRGTPASFSGDALELLEGIVEHSLESGAYPYVISEGILQARVAVGLGSVVCPDVLVEKVRFKEPPPHQEALPFLPNPLRSAGPSGPAEGDGRRDR